MTKTIIITGTSGFVGGGIAKYLQNKFKIIKIGSDVDLTKTQSWDNLQKHNPYGVIHCAAKIPYYAGQEEIYQNNITMDRHMISFIKKTNAKLIYLSSTSVYGLNPKGLSCKENRKVDPSSDYTKAKHEIEKKIIISYLKYFIFRICAPYGIGQKTYTVLRTFISDCLSNKPLNLYGDGARTQQFTHVLDIAKACESALGSNKYGVYNIASDQRISMKKLAFMVKKVLKKRSDVIYTPSDDLAEIHQTNINITKAKKHLKWKPTISLEKGIKMCATYVVGKNTLHFNELPFFWKPTINKNKQTRRFVLRKNNKGLLYQEIDLNTLNDLKKAYGEGSEIVGLMDKVGPGYHKTKDFILFMKKTTPLINKDILEIGCGTGYLLHRLKNNNFVIGYEPGFSKLGKYGDVDVIEEMYPSSLTNHQQFDVIIACNLLEHLFSPETIFHNIKQNLKKNGHLMIIVPDCKKPIKYGDPSMLMHEHTYYFTKETLTSFLATQGFKVVSIKSSKNNNYIFCVAQKREDNYFKEVVESINKFEQFLKENENKSLGVYIPNRALNMLYIFKDLINVLNITLRFFDDDPSLHNKYLPGFDIKIENMDTLVKTPPDTVLIYSFTFGKEILNIIASKLRKTTVWTIEEVFKY